MTNTNPPESTSARLDRLESIFTNMAETVLAQNDVLEAQGAQFQAQISQLDAQGLQFQNRISALEALTASNARAIEALAATTTDLARAAVEASQDRQAWQTEIRRIWEYLLQQSGNGNGRGTDE